ncbi:hypothetical protein LFYK43_07290 [Ligilactobacillus salitolerans]|uniref:Transposase DDE domain-containing protein n=1 Tax=Ligilactobacillus salitolerans TaxID=1808352 RepID=A0A401IRV7_9LACO|nr:hypothetical protein LFYK43_07290 [Ligilactobacillus salitolerans]
MRPGNLYTSNGAEDFLRPILQNYASQDVLVRADSGFAKPAIYAACEAVGAKFVIRLKANQRLRKIAEHLITVGNQDCAETEIQYHTLRNYRVDSWDKAYTVIVKSTRQESEFLFRHEFIVSNLEKTFPQDVYQLYQQCGTMEDLIKEVKAGFFFNKTDSSTFVANHFRMLLSGVAYNLIQAMKMLILPAKLEKNDYFWFAL